MLNSGCIGIDVIGDEFSHKIYILIIGNFDSILLRDTEGNVNTVPKINCDEQNDISILKTQLFDIKKKLLAYDDVDEILYDAIEEQNWFTFKNKPQVVFDRRTGLLYPNFNHVKHVTYKEWGEKKASYGPNGIDIGQWEILSEIFYYDERTDRTKGSYFFKQGSHNLRLDYPKKFRGAKSTGIFISKHIDKLGQLKKINYITGFSAYDSFTWYITGSYQNFLNYNVFPVLKVLNNPKLLPDHPSMIGKEKGKIILELFIKKEWIPIFEPFLEQFHNEHHDNYQNRVNETQKRCDSYNSIFALYYEKRCIEKRLLALGLTYDDMSNMTALTGNKSSQDFLTGIQNYNFSEINQSVWKYCLSAQKWLNSLLGKIDEWENEHLSLVKNTVELNQELEKKLPVSINITAEEKQLLETQLQQLKKRLDLGLTPLRSKLINLLSESQQISSNLEQTHTLLGLAQLEQQARPSFELLAEHTATLCTKTLKEMEWLGESLDFVKTAVSAVRKSAEDYFILVDKYQQDLNQIGLESSIETEEIAKWFSEWRNERLTLLKQIQPLLDAGLNKTIDEQMVIAVLTCIEQYQTELDQFYLQKRLGIHTTYAFQPNGHRQEKLEKEQALTKLVHHFMQQLEKVIFNTQTTAQKIWLIRFSETWQQGLVNEITDFLAKEQLIERDDVVQIMSEELRKVQQQNLAACLQDAQSYSEALAQREKDVNTLIFKMRKALMK